jgi:hypothetical protein
LSGGPRTAANAGSQRLETEAKEEGVPFRGRIREKLGRGLAGSLEVGGGRKEGGQMARA